MLLAAIHQCEKGWVCLFVQTLYFASLVKDLFVSFAQFVFVTDAFARRRVFGWAGPSNGSPAREGGGALKCNLCYPDIVCGTTIQ